VPPDLDDDLPDAPPHADALPGLAVLSGLTRANARLPDALEALRARPRTDLVGLPGATAAMLLARAARRQTAPFLVVVADVDAARAMAADLSFFLGAEAGSDGDGEAGDGEGLSDQGGAQVLVYPGGDISPYADVAPDRRATMERLATLFHLAHDLPFRFLIAPAPALLRRVTPRRSLVERSMVVSAEDELDRERLLRVMTEGGYMRVPVVEDPGTFAVRGSLIDVFPPHSRHPARIELDDWLVTSIKLFEPEDQRTLGTVERIFVHPARQELAGPEEMALARVRVRELCDAIDMPTRAARQLLEDLESGRAFLGLEGLLPAFHEELETVFDYLPSDLTRVVMDPSAVMRAVDEELRAAEADLEAKRASRSPAFPMHAVYAAALRPGPAIWHDEHRVRA
jgi:transcription-repair coupling factor (superfamily II helicase)